MKKHFFSFPPEGIRSFFFIVLLLLFSGTGCGLHREVSLLAPEELPALLVENETGMHSFKGIGMLTLPENLTPGGSLQLAYTGVRKEGLRIAALTPMGTPFLEIAATPEYAQVRDMESGKLRKTRSFTSLSKQALGFPIVFEDLLDLLADRLPVPDWTRASTDPGDPRVIILKSGNRLKAKFFRDEKEPGYKMEYFSGGESLYTITRISDQPRIWQIEKPGYKLLLRIRVLAESAPVPADLFSLESR